MSKRHSCVGDGVDVLGTFLVPQMAPEVVAAPEYSTLCR
jgi:hypothetical protein